MATIFPISYTPIVAHIPQCTYTQHHVNMCKFIFFPSLSLFSSLPLALHAYTPLNKPWTLVGVADGAHVIVWRGSGGALPSVTLTLEGTFQHRQFKSRRTCTVWYSTCTAGESVSELAWDSLSNTCLVLDKFRQVHFFKNCTAQCHI